MPFILLFAVPRVIAISYLPSKDFSWLVYHGSCSKAGLTKGEDGYLVQQKKRTSIFNPKIFNPEMFNPNTQTNKDYN